MSMTFHARRITAATLAALQKKPADVVSVFEKSAPKGWSFEDQMFAAINHCLTGDAWVSKGQGAAIHGGKPIGPEGNYGQVRFVEAGVVVKVSELLAKIGQKKFLAKFDAEAMNEDGEIYPPVEEDDGAILWERFCDLRALYDETANAGDALLLYVS